MTELQIDYMRAQEQERANKAGEAERHRANTENERITEAYNYIRSELERQSLGQTERELTTKEVDSMLKRAAAGDRAAFDELLTKDGDLTAQDKRSKRSYWLKQFKQNLDNVVGIEDTVSETLKNWLVPRYDDAIAILKPLVNSVMK